MSPASRTAPIVVPEARLTSSPEASPTSPEGHTRTAGSPGRDSSRSWTRPLPWPAVARRMTAGAATLVRSNGDGGAVLAPSWNSARNQSRSGPGMQDGSRALAGRRTPGANTEAPSRMRRSSSPGL